MAYYRMEKLTSSSPTVTPLPQQSKLTSPATAPYLIGPEGERLLLDGDTLWQLEEDGQPTARLQLPDYGMMQNGAEVLCLFCPQPDELLLITRRSDGMAYEYHLLDLNAAKPETAAQERRVVRVAVCNVYQADIISMEKRIQQAVRQFNYQQDDIFVEMMDYSADTCESMGYRSILERLQKDILDKTTPDVLLMCQQPEIKGLQRNGFFLDLYPLLDADPELRREDFLPNILQMGEFDGALTTVPVSYTIQTTVGVPAVVGDKLSWTWAEYDDLIAATPQLERAIFCVYPPPDLALHYLRWGGDKFLDYKNGVCHLDTPEFIRLLEDCAALPQTPSSESEELSLDLRDGRVLTKLYRLYNFYNLRPLLYEFVDGFGYALDDGFVFKGLPSDAGNGSCAIPQLQVAIATTCADQDAAWQFVRQFLLPSFQTVELAAAADGFPSRKDSLQQLAEDSMQDMDYPGYGGYSPFYLDHDVVSQTIDYWRSGIPAEYVQMAMELVEATTVCYQDDGALNDILFEELDIYFSGARSAADTAAVLQDRIGTYLQEQM